MNQRRLLTMVLMTIEMVLELIDQEVGRTGKSVSSLAKGSFTQAAAFDTCGCSSQFSKNMHCNSLPQPHASNAACVNEPKDNLEYFCVSL